LIVLLLAQGGEFGFVLLSAALAGLLIAPEAVTLFSAVITLSMLASLLLMACYRRLPWRGRDPAAGLAGPEEAEDRSVIVIGYGRFGQIVTQLLHARGVAVTLIDAEPDTIERSREFGWTVWFGDGFRPEVLRAAGADRARMLIVTAGGPWDPARLEAVRSRFPNLAIIARAHDREHYMRLVAAGVDGAVRELFLGAVALGRLALEKLGTDRETVEAVADEIMRANGTAAFMRLDVTDEESWRAIVAATVQRFGKLDVLVNNAGVFFGKGLEEIELDEWHRLVAVNMTGVFLGTRLAVPALREAAKASAHGSAIVNLASIAGLVGSQLDPLYSMTKGGVTLFTKSAALDFGRKGYRIRVNSIHPGLIQTEMGAQAMVSLARRTGANDMSATQKDMAGTVPWGRLGVAEDIAKGIVFLASDDAGYMTGAGLVVDGGVTAA
jgi:NAD(P)-dependent dehydrogenase (short-subunit alcohol dehydrogenase family)